MAPQKDIQEFKIQMQRVEDKVDRLVSDAESEKEVRKRRNEQIDKRLLEGEIWRSKVEGTWLVLKVIVGLLCSIVGGLLIWALTK